MMAPGGLLGDESGSAIRGDEGQPKHEQLRDFIVRQVKSGQIQAGQALPPEIRMAESLGIARSTVRQALATLEQEGIVRRVHGKGTFVHEQVKERLQKGQNLFALIVPQTTAGFYPSLQVSFEEAAAGFHSQVVVCNSNNEIDRQGNSILQLMDLGVAGVAIVPTAGVQTPAYQIRQLHKRNIPVVCCSRRVEGVETPLLGIPFEAVGLAAGKLIREAGHRVVAFQSGFESAAGKAYEAGFRQALGSRVHLETYYGVPTNLDLAVQEAGISAELERLFGMDNPPTAIFATFDSLAELAYVLLSRMGLRVPEDVSLVGFGATSRSGALQNRMTSITIDEAKMAHDAIEILEQMRTGELPLTSREIHMLPLGLHSGRTLAAPLVNMK